MTPRAITFDVYGTPQPKGSARAFVPQSWAVAAVRAGHAPRAIVTTDNPKSKDWAHAIAVGAQAAAAGGVITGPVRLALIFRLARPKSLPAKIRHHCKKPDVDKLARCAIDALVGVLVVDDAQVVELVARKIYALDGQAPRVSVRLEAAPLTPGALVTGPLFPEMRA